MEGTEVRWSLQRTSHTSAEKGGQNKFVKSPSQALIANTWVKANFWVDYVCQCTLEEFPHPWRGETDSISGLLKPFEQKHWSVLHAGEPGITTGGCCPSLGTDMVGRFTGGEVRLLP